MLTLHSQTTNEPLFFCSVLLWLSRDDDGALTSEDSVSNEMQDKFLCERLNCHRPYCDLEEPFSAVCRLVCLLLANVDSFSFLCPSLPNLIIYLKH